MPAEQKPRATTKVDRHIGEQIRIRRTAARMSQDALAEAIGVTFQQIQKYERATNRVSASKLLRIAQAMRVPVTDLLPASPETTAKASAAETIDALKRPIARLNANGRALLVLLAQALTSHASLR